MLKPYSELAKLDVLPYCEIREDGFHGKKEKIPYLPWARCIDLLHENGAEEVWYEPLTAPDGGYLFKSAEAETKDGRQTGCWFVKVEIHIDDKVFTMAYPLMNGTTVIYSDQLNQNRINTAHARAFVKGVAIRTGLGFGLWLKEADSEPAPEDLDSHNIYKIKERIEQIVTAKLKEGYEVADLGQAAGFRNEKEFRAFFDFAKNIAEVEKRLKAL